MPANEKMPPPTDSATTSTSYLLGRFSAGDPEGSARLLERLYGELHTIARSYMRKEQGGHTLQPTALVNEAYLRLAGTDLEWQDKVHFLATAARTMRRILVDHARRRTARKRGGRNVRITLDENLPVAVAPEWDLVALNKCLDRLAELSERQARVVDLRYFAGLSVEETARILGISERTVKGDARVAKAWLRKQLEMDAGGS